MADPSASTGAADISVQTGKTPQGRVRVVRKKGAKDSQYTVAALLLKTDRVGGRAADESLAIPYGGRSVVCLALGLREELTNGSPAGALHLYLVGVAAIVARVRRVELGHRDHRKSVHVDRHLRQGLDVDYERIERQRQAASSTSA